MSLEQLLADFGITEDAMQDMLSDKGIIKYLPSKKIKNNSNNNQLKCKMT